MHTKPFSPKSTDASSTPLKRARKQNWRIFWKSASPAFPMPNDASPYQPSGISSCWKKGGGISPIWLKTGRGPRMMIPQIWGRGILEKINEKGTLRRIRVRKNVPTLPDAQTPVLPTASAEDKALLPALPCGAGALMPIKPLERRDAVTAVKAEAEVTAPSCALSAWMNRFGYLINEYYRLEKAGVPDERFPDYLKRLYRITDTESPDELAAVLACPPVQVEEAVRRSRIPAWWLLYLAARRSISPQWLLTGEGTPFFAPRHLPDHR